MTMRLPDGAWLALGALPVIAASAEDAALEEDFLDYLAEFDDEDDWSWFDSSDDGSESKPKEPAPAKSTTAEKPTP